jgi:hypothetical protein
MIWKRLAAASLALAFVASSGSGFFASAANGGSITGGGRRIDQFGNHWSFGGAVHLLDGGLGSGQFQLVLHLPPPLQPTRCHYDTFTNFTIVGNVAAFDATGVCSGENQFGTFQFAAANHFTIVDNGEPGRGVDVIDVNFLGPIGIALPGGLITGGNFQVRSP